MIIAVLGGGNGGASAVVDLEQRGFQTRLWNRSAPTLDAYRKAGGIRYCGALGQGLIKPRMLTTALAEAVDGADIILVCLPTTAHAALAAALAALGTIKTPVVLNPGHTGGVLAFMEEFRRRGAQPPPTAELSTLTYVARKPEPGSVRTTAVAKHVWLAALPGSEPALTGAQALYPCAEQAADVLFSGLANVNMILHPPGAILGAAWVEARAGDFTFYVEGMPDGVGRALEALDRERLAVAAEYGHSLPDLFAEMQSVGTIEPGAERAGGLAAAIRGGLANAQIKAPDSLTHRYYHEDFWYGIRPFLVFADIAGVHVPVAESLMRLAQALAGDVSGLEGRTAKAMGIAGMNKRELLQLLH